MQATEKANRETQRAAAYESLHYACLQAVEILKPTTIKSGKNTIVNIDVLNAETLGNYQFRQTTAEISVTVDINDTGSMLSIKGNISVKSETFAYTFALDNIEQLYKKLAKVLPEYRNTYDIERFETETETETETPDNWLYCATITDKKDFKAVAKYANEYDQLCPAMHHVHINETHGETCGQRLPYIDRATNRSGAVGNDTTGRAKVYSRLET